MIFYTYELVIHPGETVCYVGKGHGDRMHDHLKFATNPKSRWYNREIYQKLREILFSGKTFSPRIVFESQNETEALNEETRRINLYGPDNLLNSVWVRPGFGKMLKPCVKKKSQKPCAMTGKLQNTGLKIERA